MQVQRQIDDIAIRIEEIECRLAKIDEAIARQMKLSFFSRQKDVCNFLVIEKKIATAQLSELKWVINA